LFQNEECPADILFLLSSNKEEKKFEGRVIYPGSKEATEKNSVEYPESKVEMIQ